MKQLIVSYPGDVERCDIPKGGRVQFTPDTVRVLDKREETIAEFHHAVSWKIVKVQP